MSNVLLSVFMKNLKLGERTGAENQGKGYQEQKHSMETIVQRETNKKPIQRIKKAYRGWEREKQTNEKL